MSNWTMQFDSIGEHGSIDAPPGSRPWAISVRRELQSALHDREWSVQQLKDYLGMFEQHEGYRQAPARRGQGFDSFEEFCSTPEPFGLGYDLQVLQDIIAGRRKRRVDEIVKDPLPLLDHGGDRKTTGQHDQADSISLKHGTSSEYQVARLKRDHPDLFEKVRAGELSPYRAAVEAGFVRPKINLPVDPESACRILCKHFSTDELGDLYRRLGDVLMARDYDYCPSVEESIAAMARILHPVEPEPEPEPEPETTTNTRAPRPRITAEERGRVRTLLAQGSTIAEIAELINRSRPSVIRIARHLKSEDNTPSSPMTAAVSG